MKMTITMIRSGSTASGEQGVFTGVLDEPLSKKGREQIELASRGNRYPPVQIVFSSNLVRCVETASLIYPNLPTILLRGLRAFDYGTFTGKSYSQAVLERPFQDWAWSPQLLAFPGGENPHAFSMRAVLAFRGIVNEMQSKQLRRAAIVSHGQILQAILQRFCTPHTLYGCWPMENGGSVTVEYNLDTATMRIKR